MARVEICGDFYAPKDAGDGSRATGLTLWLLPEGASAPGGLVQITESSDVPGRYLFGATITNGLYTIYSGSAGSQVKVTQDSEDEQIRVMRSGIPGEGW